MAMIHSAVLRMFLNCEEFSPVNAGNKESS